MIHGVDCKAELPDQVIDEIRSSWLEHLVVFFPEQYLEPAEQLAFARRFGVPVEYPMIQGMEEFPEVVEVVKLPHETHNFGGIWHSDTTYLESPQGRCCWPKNCHRSAGIPCSQTCTWLTKRYRPA